MQDPASIHDNHDCYGSFLSSKHLGFNLGEDIVPHCVSRSEDELNPMVVYNNARISGISTNHERRKVLERLERAIVGASNSIPHTEMAEFSAKASVSLLREDPHQVVFKENLLAVPVRLTFCG